MKVVSIVGTRPQLVKLGAMAAAFATTDHHHRIIHTGQHYDTGLSDVFFSGLGIPEPDFHLGVGSGSHGRQTGAMLAAIDAVLEHERPDWVLVYGDTNSTIAGALSAVKQHLPVAHLEAGLRSFNRQMPEEHNRVLTDHCADLLLAPTEEAVRHLSNEGLADRTVLAGDVMVDVCLRTRDRVLTEGTLPELPPKIDVSRQFLLATIHRAENTDHPGQLGRIVDSLANLDVPVALVAHPRLVDRARKYGIKLDSGSIHVCPPLPYADLVAAVLASVGVVTDSGGLQKETYLLGRPCTTLRTETEWTETLRGGWNVLVPDTNALPRGAWQRLCTRPEPTTDRGTPYGDGHAAQRVIALLERHRTAKSVS